MSKDSQCPRCSTLNKIGTNYCVECGQFLKKGPQPLKSEGGNIISWIADKTNSVLNVTDDFIDAFTPRIKQVGSKPQVRQQSKISATHSRGSDETLSPDKISPQEPGENKIARSLRQLVGYGTDIGRLRDHNEDYVSKFALGLEQVPGTPEVGLYIVADGMGGHQAGEKASESVIKDVVINRIQEQMQKLQSVPKLKRITIKLDDYLTPGDILREAIEQANDVLVNTREASSGSDRGTTITAALIVGSNCSIANVGDSRTYLLRKGKLNQITRDHSLVAKLVASNQIDPSEVRSHPRRNQILRTLGDRPGVKVDIFTEILQTGDQLLLCSDGLWEMVLDDAISKIMMNSRTPQAACDQLIETANTEGGEDNISVIVIWLE